MNGIMTLNHRTREAQLWADYQQVRSIEARNRLIEFHLPLVRTQACKLVLKIRRNIPYEDLFQAGIFGLMQAVEKFQPARRLRFSTYAITRIRGSIIDHVRDLDHVSRTSRYRNNQYLATRERLQAALGRVPTDAEITGENGNARRLPNVHSINTEVDGEQHPIHVVDYRVRNPAWRSHCGDLKQAVAKGLNETERLVLMLYYYEELTMLEIGEALGLTQSRVSQIHAELLKRLRYRMRHRVDEFEPA